ncbi:acyl-CoA thioesterase [bacterium]|nr:acyl-CoA thioesterase [bacterium]MBP9811252.1 acyl-CoA thioesterase [bacterium]
MNSTEVGRRFETTMVVKVATYDIDYANHVSNIVYFRWLEDLRLQLLEENFPLADLMAEGYMPILASSSIEYKRAIKLFDKPIGHMWIEKLGAATMQFRGEFRVDGVLTTKASHVGLFVDAVRQKPVKLPKQIVSRFENYNK